MTNKLRDQLVRLPIAPEHTWRWPDSKKGKRKHVYMKNRGSHDCGSRKMTSFHRQDHLASANYVANPGQNTCFPLPIDGRTWPRAQSQRRKPFAFENDRKSLLRLFNHKKEKKVLCVRCKTRQDTEITLVHVPCVVRPGHTLPPRLHIREDCLGTRTAQGA